VAVGVVLVEVDVVAPLLEHHLGHLSHDVLDHVAHPTLAYDLLTELY
jgi:hypothetical protein